MNVRTVALVLGTVVTTFLLAGAASIELAPASWGDGPGVGIAAVFVGLVVGVLAGGLVAFGAGRLSRVARTAVVAYATFGVAFLVIAATSYVDLPGVDEVVTLPVQVAVSLVVTLVAALLAGRGRATEPVASA